MKIDRSRFTPSELAQYEALIARAVVPDDMDDMHDTRDTNSPTRQRPAPELAAALERLKRLERLLERRELADIARKYALLGENQDELINTLLSLKQDNEASYQAYIAALDKSLNLIRKSGLFSELGKKSSTVPCGSSVPDRIRAEAEELRRQDPSLSRTEAIARAWENHPELVAEYDKEYQQNQRAK